MAALLACLLLGVLVGGATWAFTGRQNTVTASQVLGVQARDTGTPDGSVTSARQWSIVGSSEAFSAQIEAGLGQNAGAMGDLLVTAEQGSPVVIVTARSRSASGAESLLNAAVAGLTAQSARTDERYPLLALTEVSTREQAQVPPVTTSVIAGVVAAAVAAGILMLGSNRRRYESSFGLVSSRDGVQ